MGFWLESLKAAVIEGRPEQKSLFRDLVISGRADFLEEFLRFWEGAGRPRLLFSPVHLAVEGERGWQEALELLWRWGFSLEEPYPPLDPPIFLAIEREDAELLGYLLRRRVDPNSVTNPPARKTALIMAVVRGWLEGAEVLPEAGADPLLPDREGHLPAHYLPRFFPYSEEHKKAVLRLAERLIPDGHALKALRAKRRIPSLLCALVGSPIPEVLEIALEKGIRPDDPDEEERGFSPLVKALYTFKHLAARTLLKRGFAGSPEALAKGVGMARDPEVLAVLLEKVGGTEDLHAVAKALLSSSWKEGIEALLPYLSLYLSGRPEKAAELLREAACNPHRPSPRAVLFLAERASRDAVEEAYGHFMRAYEDLKRRKDTIPNQEDLSKVKAVLWGLSALLEREGGLEALKEL